MNGGAARILALGAHPDDVEIYCLGLLLALRERGWTIGWAVATDGQGALPDGAAPDLRRAEALAAGERVGVTPGLLGLVDGALDYTADALARVRHCIRDFAPSVVVTHSPNDYHADHRVLSRLVADTCPAGVGLVYCDTMLGVGFEPVLLADVTATYELKIEALRAHASQGVEPFEAGLRTWHRFRALQSGNRAIQYAEAFAPFETVANRKAVQRFRTDLFGSAP